MTALRSDRDIPDSPVAFDPFQMSGLREARDILRTAVGESREILVFGDYDVDGITSTAILVELLGELGAQRVRYGLPDREHGYGIKLHHVEQARADGVDLIVMVDNGISAFEPVSAARKLGMDVIVIDHHEPKEELPEADAIINPKQKRCRYPFKGLAAAGLALKFAQACCEADVERKPFIASLLDLVALGTIADVAPMVSENHSLVRIGLQALARTRRPGLDALKRISNVQRVDTASVAFRLAPRLNSAGRIGTADIAYRLLVTKDRDEAIDISRSLDALNQSRKDEVDKAILEATAQAARQQDEQMVTVLGDWHPGVTGLVAGRLCESFQVPVLSFTRRGVDLVGSARSVPGFDVTSAIGSFSEILKEYGGHAEAAGLTLSGDHFEEFDRGIHKLAADRSSGSPVKVIEVDAVLTPDQITRETVEMVRQLDPFGPGNPKPVFAALGCKVVGTEVVGSARDHLKLKLQSGNRVFEALWWREAGRFGDYPIGSRADVAFEAETNRWNGQERIVLHVRGIREG